MRREEGSLVSAVRIGMAGGESGWAAHCKACANLEGFRPARARVLRGVEGLLRRNLRASRTTYLPVKPEAPRMMMS